MGKWFTCAPCRFVANESFFWRDSGLLSRALQELGHESQVVLLGPGYEGDLPGVVRASPEELASAQWWRALELDGVIMMAWARHRDTPIVRAIAASGTPLVLHIDGAGIPYPIGWCWDTLKGIWYAQRGTNRPLPVRGLSFIKTAFSRAVITFLRHSYLKYRHMRYGDVVTLQTPTSLEGHQLLCSFYGGANHGVNLLLGGIHIPPQFAWDPSIAKEKRVVAIGRWEALEQKRPFVLMAVCAALGEKRPDVKIDIFGTKTKALEQWHAGLDPRRQEQIVVHGVKPGPVVAEALQRAQITFFPSSHEGVPLSMFEGLACGATTVGLDIPDMPGARWAADCQCADLAERDTTEAYVAALEQGLSKWESGEYTAEKVSKIWVPLTRPRRLVQLMLEAVASRKRS